MTNIKYLLVMMCLILSYGLCVFAEEEKIARELSSTIDSSIDLNTVSELMPEEEDSAYKDFEPDYVFSESDEALLDKDIGNY